MSGGLGTPTTPPRTPEAIWTKPLIATYTLALLLGVLVVAMITNNHDAVMLITGAVVTNGGAVINYYFGSSSGSERKTDILAQPPKP